MPDVSQSFGWRLDDHTDANRPVGRIQQRRNLSLLLTVLSALTCASLMPAAYYLWMLQGGGAGWPARSIWPHLYMNAAANFMVLIVAATVEDRLDKRVGAVISSVLMAHGMLAFLCLAFRLFYSNEVILVAAATSVFFGFVVLFLRQRLHRTKAALFGPRHDIVKKLEVDYDLVDDPQTDLRPYDLVLTTSVDPQPGWATSIAQAMMAGKPVRHVAEYLEEEQGVVSIEHFHLDHLPIGGLTSYRVRKRAMDIALTIIAVPVVVPLVLIAGIAIWVTMGRPIVFVQERVGLGGRTFRMYKLRTMRPAKADAGQMATSKADMRVTPLGRWLRRFRIDELPQLWNVLKGDMSLIGPRPEQPALTASYCNDLPAFAYRSLVRPGITGWAQVRAGYAADLEETRIKLGYDLFYLKNFSFSLDVRIIMRTFGTLLLGSGVR